MTIDITVAIVTVRKLVPATSQDVSCAFPLLPLHPTKLLPICRPINRDALPTLDTDEKQQLAFLERSDHPVLSSRAGAAVGGRGIHDPATAGDTLQEIVAGIARGDVGGFGDRTGVEAEGCERGKEESGELHDGKGGGEIHSGCVRLVDPP